MAIWPASLPQQPLQDGYQETEPDLLLRSSMDVGPAKVRRRYTAGVKPYKLSFAISSAHKATFQSFYLGSISSGVYPFTFPDPDNSASTISIRITKPPLYTSLGGLWQKLEFEAEKLP